MLSELRPRAAQRVRLSGALILAWLSVTSPLALHAESESITFEPPLATTADIIVAVVHQTNSCRVWIDVAPSGGVLTVLAREGLSPCPPDVAVALATQRLSLGRLSVGIHSVEARIQPPSNAVLATAAVAVQTANRQGDLRATTDPRLPTSEDAVALRVQGAAPCVPDVLWASVDGFVVDVQPAFTFDPCPPFAPVDRTFALGALPPGEYRVAVGGTPIGGFHVGLPASALSLSFDGVDRVSRWFRATLDRAYPPGQEAQLARAVALGNQAGYFWFFDPGNVEVSLKILDGRPLNGHFWLFASALTDRPYTLTVVDQGRCEIVLDAPICPTRTYSGGPGEIRSVVDLSAFAD